jgi:hypothetical protein
MSNTTNDGAPEATELAFVEDAEGLSLQRAPDAEDAKALGQPIGIYGVGKYGECRSLSKEEIAAGADRADVPVLEKTEA